MKLQVTNKVWLEMKRERQWKQYVWVCWCSILGCELKTAAAMECPCYVLGTENK